MPTSVYYIGPGDVRTFSPNDLTELGVDSPGRHGLVFRKGEAQQVNIPVAKALTEGYPRDFRSDEPPADPRTHAVRAGTDEPTHPRTLERAELAGKSKKRKS